LDFKDLCLCLAKSRFPTVETSIGARWDNEGGAAKGAPQKARDDMTSLAKEEEHILRCLGAAVIMQWDDLPTGFDPPSQPRN
jgi:hypothetical protein